MPEPITITVELDAREAWCLAQFCKRVSYDTARRHSDPGRANEPYEMLDVLGKVGQALREKGVSPR